MKKSFLALFLLICAISGFSQDKKKKYDLDESKVLVIPKNLFTPNKEKNDKLDAQRKDLIDQLTRIRQSGQGTYSHSTPYGKVYSMPRSNMACLVPDVKLNAPMPGSTPSTIAPSTMPNAFKPQKLIPDNK